MSDKLRIQVSTEIPSPEIFAQFTDRIKARIFGVLVENDKNGHWEKFLDSILMELLALPNELRTLSFYLLFYKLTSLKFIRRPFFRTMIFDSMSLVQKYSEEVLNGLL